MISDAVWLRTVGTEGGRTGGGSFSRDAVDGVVKVNVSDGVGEKDGSEVTMTDAAEEPLDRAKGAAATGETTSPVDNDDE